MLARSTVFYLCYKYSSWEGERYRSRGEGRGVGESVFLASSAESSLSFSPPGSLARGDRKVASLSHSVQICSCALCFTLEWFYLLELPTVREVRPDISRGSMTCVPSEGSPEGDACRRVP